MTGARRLGAVLILLLLSMLGAAGVASAHDTLISSDPANGSTVTSALTRVTLNYDLPVQNYDPVLVVTGPNGNVFSTGPATVDGSSVWTQVGTMGPAGVYRAAYRIVSADGHPVTGEITFTVAAAAAGTATGSTPAGGQVVGPPASSAGTPSGGLSGWLWVGIAVAVLLIAGAAVIALRRPKPRT